jgi:hypothetical protein
MTTDTVTKSILAPATSDWLVQPEQTKVWDDAFWVLHVSVDGKEFHNVHPRRAFPLSGHVDYVSFLDEKDKEVALLARPHKLDKASRQALEKALGRMYYVAKIIRVDEVKETMGVTHWEVQTDRGYAAFEVVALDHIRKLPEGRLLITDADGNRFEIDDIRRLDSRSQARIESEI